MKAHRTAGCLTRITGGRYSIGVSPETAHECHRRFSREMKIDWLMNCTPVHDVSFSDVLISPGLVTVAEFNMFVDDTGYRTEAEIDGWGWIWHDGWVKERDASWRNPFRGEANRIYQANAHIAPVLQVSWNDAGRYCRWRSLREPGCRLLTEAEWEIFAGVNGLPSMNVVESHRPPAPYDASAYMNDIVSALDDSLQSASLSLVWEWVQDCYDAYPGGPAHGEFGDTYRVMRGGSLRSHALQRTCDFRFRRCPTARSSFYGFRCAFDTDI